MAHHPRFSPPTVDEKEDDMVMCRTMSTAASNELLNLNLNMHQGPPFRGSNDHGHESAGAGGGKLWRGGGGGGG
eukprot:CAMPEP_0182572802 /NCGR_PEP_ID=MMETSP1324-20130603/17902_1 /TAXON_ID=236786 /ORGANISM="Florenciella sp., Strain RCC1587" /LENGTH=73 /DNA_ID=CAMNT_0024787813 /DNA_START=88 /DNA_END=306 /DNA_ORIENTATION=+